MKFRSISLNIGVNPPVSCRRLPLKIHFPQRSFISSAGDINIPTLKIAPVKSPTVYFFFSKVSICVYWYSSLSRVYAYLKGNGDGVKVVTDCSACGYSPEGLKSFFRDTWKIGLYTFSILISLNIIVVTSL